MSEVYFCSSILSLSQCSPFTLFLHSVLSKKGKISMFFVAVPSKTARDRTTPEPEEPKKKKNTVFGAWVGQLHPGGEGGTLQGRGRNSSFLCLILFVATYARFHVVVSAAIFVARLVRNLSYLFVILCCLSSGACWFCFRSEVYSLFFCNPRNSRDKGLLVAIRLGMLHLGATCKQMRPFSVECIAKDVSSGELAVPHKYPGATCADFVHWKQAVCAIGISGQVCSRCR